MAICSGDPGLSVTYTGDFKATPLAKFMRDFQSGKKCQKMIKLDANTDFGAFRASQLKEFLLDRGVKCIECTEKKDYVKRLQDLIREQAPDGRTEL